MSASAAIRVLEADVGDERTFLGVERSLTGRRWVERLDGKGAGAALAMAQRHQIPDLVARVLAGRGIAVDAAPGFLAPTLRVLMPDPSLLTDMDKAAGRIADAAMTGERVAIFGDYDVDGATSAALLARFLRHQGLDPTIYIPDRLFEGYGPNIDALKSLAASGVRLVVAVDCGSTSIEALEEGRRLGLDIVVIDHHQLGPVAPPVVAMVNPNREDDLSGLGYLAAVGLTLLTVVAVNRELRRARLVWGRPRRARSACLARPRRARNGLRRGAASPGSTAPSSPRACSPWRGAATAGSPRWPMRRASAVLRRPIISASSSARGSMPAGGSAMPASEPACWSATMRPNASGSPPSSIASTRSARRSRLRCSRKPAPRPRRRSPAARGRRSWSPPARDWHPGVVGLIAARLKERFGRPAFAIAFQPNGIGSGSGRSLAGVDLGHAVRLAVERGILVKGGGHAMAAGLTVAQSRLGELRAFLLSALGPAVDNVPESGGLPIDAALTARGATADLIDFVERAGPFGAGHPEPIFALPSHQLVYVEAVGNGHIRLSLAGGDGANLKAIAFRAAETRLGRALIAARRPRTARRRGAVGRPVAGPTAGDAPGPRRGRAGRVRRGPRGLVPDLGTS